MQVLLIWLLYLIVIGFVVFIVIGILGVSFFYAAGIKDRIKINQLESFANKIISSAESVYYAGEPSKVTITAYLPAGVTSIIIQDDVDESVILIVIESNSGTSTIAYASNVLLTPTSILCDPDFITCNEGLKKLKITAVASTNRVRIEEVS